MNCLKTVLLSIAGVAAIIVAGAACFLLPIAAAIYVDEVLGYGFPGGLLTLGACLSISIGTVLGLIHCRIEARP